MSQHHFIIQFDSKEGEFSWAVETEQAVFPDGAIYLPESERWVRSNINNLDSETETASVIDNTASETIGHVVNLLNTMYKTSGKDK